MRLPEALSGAVIEGRERGLRSLPIGTLPERLAVGRGNVLFLDGCCSHPERPIRQLSVLVDDFEQPVVGKGQPPPGRLSGSDYWWAMVAFSPVDRPRVARLRLRARLAGGGEAVAELGTIELLPQVPAPQPPSPHPCSGTEPLIAICMATYEPPLHLFERQISSIREQTHRNWICVISDDRSSEECRAAMREALDGDERFVLEPAPDRLGFYLNFERALALAPREAAFVALCDQDDRWYRGRLETLRAALEGGAKLAYSDMRIVGADGGVVSDTYWSYRRNNYTDYGSLLVANTVTGAASLFERSVLEYALPFPPRLGNTYHDHWLALVAMSLGRITYVDRPLYDYVQHGDAALGHARANAAHLRGTNRRERMEKRLERLQRLRRGRFHPGWRYLYFDLWCAIALTARVAELRCGQLMSPDKLRTLRRFRDTPQGVAWLAGRSLRPLTGATETLGRERALLAALAWRRLVGWRTRAQGLRRRRRGVRAAPDSDPALPSTRGSRSSNGTGGDWLVPILVDYFTRDGSTLMMRLLSSSPEIAVEDVYPFERKYFSYLWRWSRVPERGDWPEELWGPRAFGSLGQERNSPLVGPFPWRPRELIEPASGEASISERWFELAWAEFSRRAARRTRAEHGDEAGEVRYYAEKHLNTWLVDRGELPPHRVLVLLRDPRDTWVSIAAFEQTKDAAGGTTEERLHQIIERNRQRLRWIAELLETGAAPVVRYEELVRDLPAVARQLESWLEVELRPESVSEDKVLRKRHSTARSPEASIGRWKSELEPAAAEVITRELRSELASVGLET